MELKEKIRLDQLRQVNGQLRSTIVSSSLLGIVLGIQLFDIERKDVFYLWLITLVGTIFLRILMIALYKSNPIRIENLKFWDQLSRANVLLSTLNYSIAVFGMYFIENVESRMICIVVFAGVTAGAVALYGLYQRLLLLFNLPIILSLVVIHLLDFSFDNAILAGMFLLFFYIVHSSSKKYHANYMNAQIQNETIRNLTAEQVVMEEKYKIRNDFFSSMSHEIRTPLNGIIGLVDMLKETKLDEEQKDYLSTMKNSSNVLLTTINDVLDLSKLEAGRFQLSTAELNISQLIDSSLNLYQPLMHEKGLQSAIKYFDVDSNTGIIGDEIRLKQILNNLISNAVKFTDDGQITINVYKKANDEIQDWLLVEVEDTGIGVPEDDLNRIFNRFDQVINQKRKASYKDSTGLGLNISKELIRLMNGEIGAYNNEKGVTFWFKIPVYFKEQNNIQKQPDSIIKPDVKGTNALLVDDREVNLKVQSLMLQKLGFNVTTMESSIEAFKTLQQEPEKYKVVFTDIQMPEMDGIELTKKIRQELLKSILIIGVSAQVSNEFIESPEDFGFDDYLSKPVTFDKLTEVVCKHFSAIDN